MVTIKATPDDAEKVLNIFSKAYNLGINDFTSKTLDDGSVEAEINDSGRKYDSKVLITLEQNGVEAYISIYPALGSGKNLSKDEIYETISDEGIKVSVDKVAVEKAAKMHHENYIVDHILFATGIPAHKGRDAVISVQFSAADKKPKLNADGTVDFKNIDNVIHAKKGDILITKRPATMGLKGLTVKNAEIIPHPGKDVDIFQGEGVMLNPTGTSYIALQDGYVEFKNGLLAVHNVLFINKDVDFSTGNIKFNGTVHIRGDVLAGFKVVAKDDVIVEGVCGDCEIIAGGNIIIKTGIKGNFNNLFKAGNNVVIGYSDKAKIFAKNNLIIKKYSYNSDLYAGDKLEATAGEGIIAGGMIKAFSEVNAKQLGTQGNSKFTIYMGTKYHMDQAVEKIRQDKARMTETMDKMQDILGRFNLFKPEVLNNIKIKKLIDMKNNFESIISEMEDKEEELIEQSKAKNPKIKIKGIVFGGVTVMIFNCATTVREKISNAVFYLDEKYAEVAWVSLKDAKNIETE
ncbi:MAG: FapA family protein [Deferribacteraceae bacterium]|jgi:uncharacterized protein (DUF342 family)|nr:FapA family protein [Deferribacteraceae bacterium]